MYTCTCTFMHVQLVILNSLYTPTRALFSIQKSTLMLRLLWSLFIKSRSNSPPVCSCYNIRVHVSVTLLYYFIGDCLGSAYRIHQDPFFMPVPCHTGLQHRVSPLFLPFQLHRPNVCLHPDCLSASSSFPQLPGPAKLGVKWRKRTLLAECCTCITILASKISTYKLCSPPFLVFRTKWAELYNGVAPLW